MGGVSMITVWAIAFVFLTVCELATSTALVSIWLALGALAAMFCAIFGMSVIVQFVVFAIVSIILLILTRPIAKKLQGKSVATNYELDVGRMAEVIEDINNLQNKGRVVLNGTYWAARSDNGCNIEKGKTVKVLKVDGAKLIVTENI